MCWRNKGWFEKKFYVLFIYKYKLNKSNSNLKNTEQPYKSFTAEPLTHQLFSICTKDNSHLSSSYGELHELRSIQK